MKTRVNPHLYFPNLHAAKYSKTCTCWKCHGKGDYEYENDIGRIVEREVCEVCDGTGEVEKTPIK